LKFTDLRVETGHRLICHFMGMVNKADMKVVEPKASADRQNGGESFKHHRETKESAATLALILLHPFSDDAL